MTTIPAVRRLSPRVRRLLEANELDARGIPGTGAGGRVTAADVEAAAGAGHRSGHPAEEEAVLASPVARRRLRDAGIDLAAATRANGGDPVRGRDVEHVIETVDAGPADGRRSPARRRDTASTPSSSTATREVDASRLLANVRAAQAAHTARHGRPIPLVVPVAAAVAGALAATPALRDAGGAPVTLGLVLDDDVITVADAELLTVPGLARQVDEGPGTTEDITIVVAPAAAAATALRTPTSFGVLTVGTPVDRPVRSTDELGLEIVAQRPHVTLELHHDGGEARADALLAAVAEAVARWNRGIAT